MAINLDKKYERLLIHNIQLVSERNMLYETRQHCIMQQDHLIRAIQSDIEYLITIAPQFSQKLGEYMKNIYSIVAPT